MALPVLTAVTTPVEMSTVATAVLSEVHSPPDVPSEFNVVDSPGAMVVVPDNVPAEGLFKTTSTGSVPEQPPLLVTVKV